MPNQPKPQDILNSIGAMAEMMDAFYKQLINRGFDKSDALYLTGEFLKTIINPKQGGQQIEVLLS